VYTRETLVIPRHLLESGLPKSATVRGLGIIHRLVNCLIETGQVDREFPSRKLGRVDRGPSRLVSRWFRS
jgi:hypothetical protein